MAQIKIQKEKETEVGWQFRVEIEENDSLTNHSVSLSKDYFNNFADRFSLPEELIRKSFEFLLAREPREAILKEFDLALIKEYFPEYEKEVK